MSSHRLPSHKATRRSSFPLGLGLGALLTYFFDRDRGRRRRVLVRDQLVHAARVASRIPRITARDVAGRSAGVLAVATRWMRTGPLSDRQVAEHVRAELGRFVSHPHAVHVEVQDGFVRLSGPILAREVPPLLRAVERIVGAKRVENRLEVHEEAGRISSLQGGVPRPGNRFELLQDNWSPTARLVTGALGFGLLGSGLRAHGLARLALPVAGGALLLRATTNRDLKTLVGVGDQARPIVVHKTIHIDAPVQKVFAFWSDYQNFPRFMSRVRSVEVLDERRSHWVVTGPAGMLVEWIASVTHVELERSIEWSADGRAAVRHAGAVHFDAAGENRTRVQVEVRYVPLGGLLGHALATLFGTDPKSELDADLLRMKTMIETGRAPHDAAKREAASRPAIEAPGKPSEEPARPSEAHGQTSEGPQQSSDEPSYATAAAAQATGAPGLTIETPTSAKGATSRS